MIPIQWRTWQVIDPVTNALSQFSGDLRVAMPGIIQSFNEDTQTVSVQPALTEVIRNGASLTATPLPILDDVPLVTFRSGGFAITLPIQEGDECLLIFADTCIDWWWQNGGITKPLDGARFRHHIGDAFAILGPWSQPRKLQNYSPSSLQIRSEDGNTKIDISNGEITVSADTVNVTGKQVHVAGSETVSISGNNSTTIDGKDFLHHTHSGVASGGSTSGPVV